MDATRLTRAESDELESIVAAAGGMPESVSGHPDPVGFTADLLDRVEGGTADAADLLAVRGWLDKDAERFGRGTSTSRRMAARLGDLIAKMGG